MKTPPQTFSSFSRTLRGFFGTLSLLVIVAAVLACTLPNSAANAAQITNRSLTLEKNGSVTTGGSAPSASGGAGTVGTANHHFTFTVPTTAGVHSVKFEYCTTAAGTCTLPADVVTTSATLGTTANVSGFSLTNTTNGAPYIANAGGVPGGAAIQVTLNAVKNPSIANASFFVRITTYTSNDATTGATDAGTVTASTASPIVLSGTMPESLVFCTGQTISVTASVPDCTTATAGSIAFDKLFSPIDTAVAVSQMAASTNAGSGYAITVNGATMTSGSNTINAITVPSASNKGQGQFGLNLRANTSAAAACWPGSCSATPLLYTPADVATASNGTNLRGQPKAGYDTADTFTFNDNAVVADSGQGGGSPVASDAQIFTVSYIVNVPGSQPAGTYTATMTYICTPTF